MMRRLIALAATLVLVGACASTPDTSTDGPNEETSAPTIEAEEEDTEALIEEAEFCAEQLSKFRSRLQELDSRLSVGLQFAEYGERVGDARVAYDQVPIDQMARRCLVKGAVPLEKALGAYLKAYNRWNQCIGNIGCDMDGVTPDLQAQWATAQKQIAKADRYLDQF